MCLRGCNHPSTKAIIEYPTSPYQEVHDGLVRKLRSGLGDATQRLAQNQIDIDAWYFEMLDALRLGHANAYSLGAVAAGSPVNNAVALAFARVVMDLESYFLRGFANDLAAKDPRYFSDDGDLDLDSGQLDQRLDLYALKASGSASSGWVDGQPEDREIRWIRTAFESCPSCLILADDAYQPYTKSTLFTTPRAGDTECLTHCKCYLETDDGAGFAPVEL